MSATDFTTLPQGLPVPQDDGACDHLPGLEVPDLALPSSAGAMVNLRRLVGGTVVFCYPRTGRPGEDLPEGWDHIPGARGCTPESCGFRENFSEFQRLGVRIFGLSAQETAYQAEAVERLHLQYEMLSDRDLRFTHALSLPTFKVAGMTLIKRLTMLIQNGRIERVFYPVFPPDRHASDLLIALSTNPPAA